MLVDQAHTDQFRRHIQSGNSPQLSFFIVAGLKAPHQNLSLLHDRGTAKPRSLGGAAHYRIFPPNPDAQLDQKERQLRSLRYQLGCGHLERLIGGH